MAITNSKIFPSWIPFINLAIDELNSTMPNVTPVSYTHLTLPTILLV